MRPFVLWSAHSMFLCSVVFNLVFVLVLSVGTIVFILSTGQPLQ
jgi:hypothetical protein